MPLQAIPLPAIPLLAFPLLAVLLSTIAVPRPALAQPPAPPAPSSAAEVERLVIERAEALLVEGEAGELPIEAVLVPAEFSDGKLKGILQLLIAPGELTPGSVLAVSLMVDVRDGGRFVGQRRGQVPADAEAIAGGLFYQVGVELPETLRDLVVVVEPQAAGAAAGRWGAAVALPDEVPLEPPPGVARAVDPAPWRLGVSDAGPQVAESQDAEAQDTGAPAGSPAGGATTDRGGTSADRGRPGAIRLLPIRGPRWGSLAGSTQIETLVGDSRVARAVFLLDGEEVASDDDPPFEARIELAGPGTPQVVAVRGYAGGGELLGEDRRTVNDDGRPLAIDIAAVTGDPAAGTVGATIELSLPVGAEIDRIEVGWNQEEPVVLTAEPFQAAVPVATVTGQDYVRAAVYLRDGRYTEDVKLIGVAGVAEQVEVNLVELFTVVTDRDGGPVRDLTVDDFEVELGRERQRIERFSYADDVPLALGLVIDTSGSMQFQMNDVRRAATQFLSSTLKQGDTAFLVDYDTLPRLAHPATGDITELIGAFRGLSADGYTATFDAILFSLLEFAPGQGRRALVLLSDGDDYKSNFGVRRTVEVARDFGVPVYIIALGAGDDAGAGPGPGGGPPLQPPGTPRLRPSSIRGATRLELEAVTERTGGRLYMVSSTADLGAAYAEINAELRSQYLLTFYTEKPLTPDEREDVEVDVDRRGLAVRTVVSPD